MSKKILLGLSLVFAAALTLSAQTNFVYNFDPTDSDAWSDGDSLNSGSGILAQSSWLIDDTNGDGTGDLHAFSDGNGGTAGYQKAVFFTPVTETFDVGETITLDTTLALANFGALTGEKGVFRVGLRNAYTNGTPLVGVDYFVSQQYASKLASVTGSTTSARTALTRTDGSFHDLSVSITKSATANTFDVTTSFDGVASTSYTLENSTLYSATTVHAAIDMRASHQTGGLWLDSFSSTVVPESSAFASIFGLMALACVVSRRKRD